MSLFGKRGLLIYRKINIDIEFKYQNFIIIYDRCYGITKHYEDSNWVRDTLSTIVIENKFNPLLKRKSISYEWFD